jgi:putative methionine-R-sulfoxide reductase with GAF domain
VLSGYAGSSDLLGVFDIDSHQRDAFVCSDAETLLDILTNMFPQVRNTKLSP